MCLLVYYICRGISAQQNGKNASIYSQKGRLWTAQKINLHLPGFMQTAEPSLMVKLLMRADKNIKYSDIPFSQYQKRPDVGSWSCYQEDRHWKKILWIFNRIKVFYGMQINGNFWLWREKIHANKPYHLGLKLHKQETLSICVACLPALDDCDCREINPFNNLWLKFEDFQFSFFFFF